MPDASRGRKRGGESLLGAGLSGGTAIVFNDQAIFPADAHMLFNLYHVFLKRYLVNFVLFQNCLCTVLV